MSFAEAESQPPVANVIVVYLGPVAPHWEVRSRFGDRKLIDEFRARVLARLTLVAGAVAGDELLAEVAQLRAELDLLKREFRRLAAGV